MMTALTVIRLHSAYWLRMHSTIYGNGQSFISFSFEVVVWAMV